MQFRDKCSIETKYEIIFLIWNTVNFNQLINSSFLLQSQLDKWKMVKAEIYFCFIDIL